MITSGPSKQLVMQHVYLGSNDERPTGHEDLAIHGAQGFQACCSPSNTSPFGVMCSLHCGVDLHVSGWSPLEQVNPPSSVVIT